ncbi:hypothetical protein N7539_007004 [Penicillium diatomitis]|uniref:DUF7514 domain-containing protein n=1 Tax=Penicillium diatomitis TaxID=2819901 RepID=A0A9W9X2B5_9EURO|nr:uncharacterized protein N7539_007004 [Penicillium diatomitis]KAJ5481110.1 hypothetical protein N7539_007004 [Penicillium diatomitis]
MCAAAVPDRSSLPGDESRALILYSTVSSHPDALPQHTSSVQSDASFERPSTSTSAQPNMASAASQWGTLINPDKSPASMLEQLCLGIAQIMHSFDSNPTTDLTPDRLAAFYRKVGGNYDPLFLETKPQALSFIYQSLGCFHSLQPASSPYEPPAIPSLCPNGFVRWQTIQLLMDPDEHWRFLNNAVESWNIADAKGEFFPKTIPRDAFPSEPDPEMLQWHEGVAKRLEHDYIKRNVHRASPPNFGPFHYHFSGKDPLPEEEDYFSHPPQRTSSRRHKSSAHYDSDRPTSRRKSHRHKDSSDSHDESGHRSDPRSRVRPDGGRSGVSSPRTRSPGMSPYVDRPPRPRGRDYSAWHTSPLSGEREDAASRPNPYSHSHGHSHSYSYPPDVDPSEPSPRKPVPDSLSRHRSHRHRNLSPPVDSRGRRHSHDAYTRKPYRDLSPSAPGRAYASQDLYPRDPVNLDTKGDRTPGPQRRPTFVSVSPCMTGRYLPRPLSLLNTLPCPHRGPCLANDLTLSQKKAAEAATAAEVPVGVTQAVVEVAPNDLDPSADLEFLSGHLVDQAPFGAQQPSDICPVA